MYTAHRWKQSMHTSCTRDIMWNLNIF